MHLVPFAHFLFLKVADSVPRPQESRLRREQGFLPVATPPQAPTSAGNHHQPLTEVKRAKASLQGMVGFSPAHVCRGTIAWWAAASWQGWTSSGRVWSAYACFPWLCPVHVVAVHCPQA